MKISFERVPKTNKIIKIRPRKMDESGNIGKYLHKKLRKLVLKVCQKLIKL